MWISQKNENSQRTSSPQQKKKSWSQKTYHRVGFSFSKALRFLSRRHFKQVLDAGSKFHGQVLLFRYCTYNKGPSKIGITVSAKYGKSVKRNYLKRLVREVFREMYDQIPPGTQIHVSPKMHSIPPTKTSIAVDFLSLFSELKIKEQKRCIPT